jgi:hypothetical protein
VRQRNKPPVKKHSKNPTPGRTVGGLQSRFQNLRTTYKLKLPHLTEGGGQLPLKDRRKKENKNTTEPSDKTTTELCLKYQHQDWMLEE